MQTGESTLNDVDVIFAVNASWPSTQILCVRRISKDKKFHVFSKYVQFMSFCHDMSKERVYP